MRSRRHANALPARQAPVQLQGGAGRHACAAQVLALQEGREGQARAECQSRPARTHCKQEKKSCFLDCCLRPLRLHASASLGTAVALVAAARCHRELASWHSPQVPRPDCLACYRYMLEFVPSCPPFRPAFQLLPCSSKSAPCASSTISAPQTLFALALPE